MFEYLKIKDELEQIKCAVHGKPATITFSDGKINLENVCCEEHKARLKQILPDIEEQQSLADIMEDVL